MESQSNVDRGKKLLEVELNYNANIMLKPNFPGKMVCLVTLMERHDDDTR